MLVRASCSFAYFLQLQWKDTQIIHVANVARRAAGVAGEDDADVGHLPPPADQQSAAAATTPSTSEERRRRRRDRMIHFQEMQVHGPVALADDVARLVVDTRHKVESNVLDAMRAFEQAFSGVSVAWVDEAAERTRDRRRKERGML